MIVLYSIGIMLSVFVIFFYGFSLFWSYVLKIKLFCNNWFICNGVIFDWKNIKKYCVGYCRLGVEVWLFMYFLILKKF